MHMVAKPIKVCMCITLGDADTSLSLVGLSKCVLGVRILAKRREIGKGGTSV